MFNFLKKKPTDPRLTTADASGQYGADYYNNKWPMAPIVYTSRMLRSSNTQVNTDVKDFITANDSELQSLIQKYKLVKGSYNETVLAIQKFVVQHIQYADDEQNDKAEEFWQFPFETITNCLGDCEDGAILIASLCINAGIPAWRIKVCAGNVQDAPTAPEGGHAYCIYLADDPTDEKKFNWKIIDWCYLEDSDLAMDKKPNAKDGGAQNCYKDVWFTFNNEHSWNQTAVEIDGRIKNK